MPYAFGSGIKERTASFTKKYRFGFNNQEQEPELGDYYSFEYRVHDARLGRFLSVDPLFSDYIYQSTYVFANNSPLRLIDLFGLGPGDPQKVRSGEGLTQFLKRFGHSSDSKDGWLPLLEKLREANPDVFKDEYNSNWNSQQKWDYWNKQKVPEGISLNLPKGFHYVFEQFTPEIYSFTKEQLTLHPEYRILTYNGGGSAKESNRKSALNDISLCADKSKSRDEFPYACTVQGGIGAAVSCVSKREQSIQGGQLGALARQLKTGDNFTVILVPKSSTEEPKKLPVQRPVPVVDKKPVTTPKPQVVNPVQMPKPVFIPYPSNNPRDVLRYPTPTYPRPNI